MESIVEDLSSAYHDFVAAAAVVLETKEQSGGRKTAATDAALESFKQRWELFRVKCDNAEEFIESARQRLGSECLVDEATGMIAAGAQNHPSIPPISAVRLEQMSKAVRWLVIELQLHGGGSNAAAASGGGGHLLPTTSAPPPFDPRFSEDGAQ